MTALIETERLLLRKFNLGDAKFIVNLVNSPGWLQNIGDRKVHSVDDANRYLEQGAIKSYAVNGFGLSCIILKQDAQPIGMCGLVQREVLPHPDLGFAILPKYEGKGYMQEIAAAYLQYIRRELDLQKVLGITIAANLRSISLLERLGFTLENDLQLPGQLEKLFLFSMDLNSVK